MPKQSQIIMACMALHNFIRASAMPDEDFDMCDLDEYFVPGAPSASQPNIDAQTLPEDRNMNQFRDSIADGLYFR